MPLPPGVTLVQIDGGPSYYANNGFTYAANVDGTMAAAGAKSWDDPTWFPIGMFWAFFAGNSIATFKALGLNWTNIVDPSMDRSVLHANGIWNIDTQSASTYGNETIALHIEEPGSFNNPGDDTSVTYQAQNSPFPLTGRFLQTCFTWGQLGYNDIAATPVNMLMPAVMGTPISTTWGNVHCNTPGVDNYTFASATIPGSVNITAQIETGTASGTQDQSARGTNYGDFTDLCREWCASSPAVPAPVWPVYIETDDALLASLGGVPIKPGQMNWAVWSTLIHGARAICYFSSASDDGLSASFGFATTPQSGQVVSNFTQAASTNALVQNLAPILNSEFAAGYVTVTPAAYSFGQTPLVSVAHGRHGWSVTGIDVMAKYYTGVPFTNSAGTFGRGYCIFATYRGSQSASNVSATFTTADGYTGTVQAINADGGGTSYGQPYTLTAANGVFTDTFTSGSSVRIYQIPDASSIVMGRAAPVLSWAQFP